MSPLSMSGDADRNAVQGFIRTWPHAARSPAAVPRTRAELMSLRVLALYNYVQEVHLPRKEIDKAMSSARPKEALVSLLGSVGLVAKEPDSDKAVASSASPKADSETEGSTPESAEKSERTASQCAAAQGSPCPIWFVIGGEDKAGILVRSGESLLSPKSEKRLSAGSFVREVTSRNGRLEYELLAGAGPPRGWVSVELNHKVLVTPVDRQQPISADNKIVDWPPPWKCQEDVKDVEPGGPGAEADATAEVEGRSEREKEIEAGRRGGEEHEESEATSQGAVDAPNEDAPKRRRSYQVWEVIGGEDKGGILVREGQALGSAKLEQRLSTGAFVRELELFDERLHFEQISGMGTGPASGWVSIRLNHKELLAHRGEWPDPEAQEEEKRQQQQKQQQRQQQHSTVELKTPELKTRARTSAEEPGASGAARGEAPEAEPSSEEQVKEEKQQQHSAVEPKKPELRASARKSAEEPGASGAAGDPAPEAEHPSAAKVPEEGVATAPSPGGQRDGTSEVPGPGGLALTRRLAEELVLDFEALAGRADELKARCSRTAARWGFASTEPGYRRLLEALEEAGLDPSRLRAVLQDAGALPRDPGRDGLLSRSETGGIEEKEKAEPQAESSVEEAARPEAEKIEPRGRDHKAEETEAVTEGRTADAKAAPAAHELKSEQAEQRATGPTRDELKLCVVEEQAADVKPATSETKREEAGPCPRESGPSATSMPCDVAGSEAPKPASPDRGSKGGELRAPAGKGRSWQLRMISNRSTRKVSEPVRKAKESRPSDPESVAGKIQGRSSEHELESTETFSRTCTAESSAPPTGEASSAECVTSDRKMHTEEQKEEAASPLTTEHEAQESTPSAAESSAADSKSPPLHSNSARTWLLVAEESTGEANDVKAEAGEKAASAPSAEGRQASEELLTEGSEAEGAKPVAGEKLASGPSAESAKAVDSNAQPPAKECRLEDVKPPSRSEPAAEDRAAKEVKTTSPMKESKAEDTKPVAAEKSASADSSKDGKAQEAEVKPLTKEREKDDDKPLKGTRAEDKKAKVIKARSSTEASAKEAPASERKPEEAAPAEAAAPQEAAEEPADAEPCGRLWQVIGGEDKGGILVREGLDLASEKEDDRLSTGALIWERELIEERLHYELMTGEGPASGWVSTRLYHKQLVHVVNDSVTKTAVQQWIQAEIQKKVEESRRLEEEMARKQREAAEKMKEEAERRAAEASQRAAQEMAQMRAREGSFQQQARPVGKVPEPAAKQAPARQPERSAQKAPATSSPPAPVKQWDKADLERLETCVALDRSTSDMPALMLDIATLKRLLIKRLRVEDDEQADIWNVPQAEEKLLPICDRIYELEGLRDVVIAAVAEMHQRQAHGELLAQGVTSVDKLNRSSFQQPPAPGSLLQGSLLESLQKAARQRALERGKVCDLVPYGKAPFLVTAPHNAFLLRDGQPPHQLEQFTTGIAQQLARDLDGEALCWTRQMQWRTAFRFSLALRWKRSGVEDCYGRALDRSIRDPNYISTDELSGSPWFKRMELWASSHVRGAPGMTLHVDVHGCQDPPMWPTHAILGLGAMRQNLEGMPEDDPARELLLTRLHNFASLVEPAVAQALAPVLGVQPQQAASLRGLKEAVTETGERVETLSGAWPPGTGRLTQTQQSVYHAGISHAVQIELSLSLRRALVREPWGIGKLAQALRTSWMKAIAMESGASA